MFFCISRSVAVDESSSISDNESNLSLSSNSQSEELNSNIKRRSVRRVSSSSTNTSSKTTNTKEPLYTRRRVNQSDNHVKMICFCFEKKNKPTNKIISIIFRLYLKEQHVQREIF